MAALVVDILTSVVKQMPLMRHLEGLEFYRKESGEHQGEIYYNTGNSVVVFRVKYREQWYAMRCYTKGGSHLMEIYGDDYYPRELRVESPYSKESQWIDVVMCRWVDGIPLSRYVAEAVKCDNREGLKELSSAFDALALHLLRQDWSHGDISGENIIVNNRGELNLIDFDSKFLPQFEGEMSNQRGTKAYQSPRRGCSDFDRDTDDYSLALISTALKIISIDPSIYTLYPYEDGLLLNPHKVVQGENRAFNYTKRLLLEMGLIASYRLAELVERGDVKCPNIELYFVSLNRDRNIQLQHPDMLRVSIQDGRYGYVNNENDVVISHLFDEALDFRDGIAATRVENFWHFVNEHGDSQICGGELQEVRSFKGETCRVKRNNEWGLLFRDGKFVF